MRFYGVGPDDMAGMTDLELNSLRANSVRISARERLEFILDVGAAISRTEESSREYLTKLAKHAYDGSPDELAVIVEALTRK